MIPEQLATQEQTEAELLEKNIELTKKLAQDYGLTISPATPKEDDRERLHHSNILSEEQEKQLRYTNESEKNTFYLTGKRKEDDKEVKIIVTVLGSKSNCFAADIFSPAEYNGHGCNHDFSQSEFEDNIKFAMEGPIYESNK